MALLGKAFEYSLHCLSLLADVPKGECRSVSELAQFQDVSPTYLAKVFTRLQKAGIIRSIKGVRGGYELARSTDTITFLDIAVAVDADLTLFECNNVSDLDGQCALSNESALIPRWMTINPCLARNALREMEIELKKMLEGKTLAWLCETTNQTVKPISSLQAAGE